MRIASTKLLTERLAIIAGVAYPLTAVPQAVKVYADHTAAGLSLVSWVGFLTVELMFFAYGISYRLKPIIISGVLWLILYTLIIAGIIIYG